MSQFPLDIDQKLIQDLDQSDQIIVRAVKSVELLLNKTYNSKVRQLKNILIRKV